MFMKSECYRCEAPLPPLEGEVPNEREAEGFVRKLSKKTPQSARSGCQLPFQGSRGRFAPQFVKLEPPYFLASLTISTDLRHSSVISSQAPASISLSGHI